MVERGHRATVIFVVNRDDVTRSVRPSDFHDPCFAAAAREASRGGVEFRAVRVQNLPTGSRILDEIAVDLEAYDTREVERSWESRRSSTGWLRTFGLGGGEPKRVANGPFHHHISKARTINKRKRSKGEDAEETDTCGGLEPHASELVSAFFAQPRVSPYFAEAASVSDPLVTAKLQK
jgi:hypothetical protein